MLINYVLGSLIVSTVVMVGVSFINPEGFSFKKILDLHNTLEQAIQAQDQYEKVFNEINQNQNINSMALDGLNFDSSEKDVYNLLEFKKKHKENGGKGI